MFPRFHRDNVTPHYSSLLLPLLVSLSLSFARVFAIIGKNVESFFSFFFFLRANYFGQRRESSRALEFSGCEIPSRYSREKPTGSLAPLTFHTREPDILRIRNLLFTCDVLFNDTLALTQRVADQTTCGCAIPLPTPNWAAEKSCNYRRCVEAGM